MLLLVVMLGQMAGTYVGCLFMYNEDMQTELTGNKHSLYLSSSSMLLLAVVLGQTSGTYAYASSFTIKTAARANRCITFSSLVVVVVDVVVDGGGSGQDSSCTGCIIVHDENWEPIQYIR